MIGGPLGARLTAPRLLARGRSAGGRKALPAAVVAATAAVLWLLGGVSIGQIARYGAYQSIFVIGPGWMAYRWFRPHDGWLLRRVAFSWALGYALECAWFMATAAVGLRPAFFAFPALVAGATLALRHDADRRLTPGPGLPRGSVCTLAAVCVVALACVGVQYFGTSPLPDRVASVSYGLDSVWNLSLAAEAAHHWPVSDPTVAGTALAYHLFATFDVAATSQVTGLSLSTSLFRLWPVPLVVLVCLQLCVFGATVSRRAWVGPAAAGIVVLGSELNLDPHVGYKFANELSDDIVAISPSFLLGVVFFVPVLLVLVDLVVDRSWSRREMGLLALLLFGCAGAKATILPVLVGGLVLLLVWRFLRERRMHPPTFIALGFAACVYVAASLLVYDAAGSYGLSFDPPGAVRQMPALALFTPDPPGGLPGVMDWMVAGGLGLAGAYALFLLGAAAYLRRERPLPIAVVLLISIALAGAAPFLLFTHYGFSQVFFIQYGLVAIAPVSADGLLWIGGELRARMGSSGLAVLVGGCFAGIGIAAFAVPRWLEMSISRQNGLFSGVGLVLAGVAVVVFARLATRPRKLRTIWLSTACALILIALAAKLLTTISPAVTRVSDGQPLYSQTGNALTGDLARGLAWVRGHTDPNAVIAVNNYRDGSLYWDTGWRTPDDYYYSALGERRTFLEGWVYAQRSFEIGEGAVFAGRKVPFPRRLALNDAIFQRADRRALTTVARRWNVRYLIVDRVHNWANPRLAYLANPVFCNHDMIIYALAPKRRLERCVQLGHRPATIPTAARRLGMKSRPRPGYRVSALRSASTTSSWSRSVTLGLRGRLSVRSEMSSATGRSLGLRP